MSDNENLFQILSIQVPETMTTVQFQRVVQFDGDSKALLSKHSDELLRLKRWRRASTCNWA